MKARYVKTLENLHEHTKQLPPLRIGDHVSLFKTRQEALQASGTEAVSLLNQKTTINTWLRSLEQQD